MKETSAIVDKALQGMPLKQQEIFHLLQLTDSAQREQLFAAARIQRQRQFANKVFLYGFVYFSTYCRNECTFCFYRKSNGEPVRYRKSTQEIVEIARALAEAGVHLIDLTMGEDPRFLANNGLGNEQLIEIVRLVKQQTGLPVMISPGVVPNDMLVKLKQAGANWYACYQETHNRQLFKSLRLNQCYDKRWNSKVFAKAIGMLVEEGLLVGVGDCAQDTAHSLVKMQELGAAQIRTMSFVPQRGTPLYNTAIPDNCREINIIAVMRLLFPDKLIPASLDVEGVSGLKARLDAGANVVTSIIPPQSGLMGVSQSTLDISEGYRTVAGVTPILAECGLVSATLAEYVDWMENQLGGHSKGEAVCR
ncbi:methylornithine synthase PylB [Sporomusa sp. KB1]|jgi:methylornithine synthase|uniref:methylornithine synthase PylB n=1 Tax=Sporomusa sp. KB1 TaxID=943346 RepID=UPI00119FFE05|nr:methylornithine synthase PylB [Sporomusa sp. KB1]TWH46806.1 pyrrolysine biosynthesis protein PylB [Sporomusa sp. KB1]